MPIPMDRLVEADDDEDSSDHHGDDGDEQHQDPRWHHRASANLVHREPDPIGSSPCTTTAKVVLYRADRMHDGAIELELSGAEIDEDGRWSEVVDDLEIIHIGGDHLSIVDEPFISKIGRISPSACLTSASEGLLNESDDGGETRRPPGGWEASGRRPEKALAKRAARAFSRRANA